MSAPTCSLVVMRRVAKAGGVTDPNGVRRGEAGTTRRRPRFWRRSAPAPPPYYVEVQPDAQRPAPGSSA